MTSPLPAPLEIVAAPPERQTEALLLVLESQEPAIRTAQAAAALASAKRGESSLDGLLEARHDGKTVAAAWASVVPGRTGIVWPPRCHNDAHTDASSQLLAAMYDYLRRQRACLAIAVLDPENRQDCEVLLGHGFIQAADLLYLACPETALPREEPLCGSLQFDPYDESKRDRLASVVVQTYQQTQDCPVLNGRREIDDVLTGYRHTGRFDPQNWFLVREGEQDVGCLLLADHPDDQQMELVYMGIIPQRRGRGWGQIITRYAQWITRQRQRCRLVLAVDAANRPAHAMYEASGFTAWEKRRVLIREL